MIWGEKMDIEKQAVIVKSASRVLAGVPTSKLNGAIRQIAQSLTESAHLIMDANKLDMDYAKSLGTAQSKLDRLYLDEARIRSIADDANNVAVLPGVLGNFEGFTRPNGLRVAKIKVPLGVIGMIYESRPNVTVDATVLCLKSGNAVLLRGGKEAYNTNKAIVGIIKKALSMAGLPGDAVELVHDLSRESVSRMMKLDKYLDLLIPRGGAGLIENVKNNSTVPVIETGTGNCHIYIHEAADFTMALEILLNAKVQRPSVCNACESLLVDKSIAANLLPRIKEMLNEHKVRMLGCTDTCKIIAIEEAADYDFYTEFNDLTITVKTVDGLDAAIVHIDEHGTRHSETIITQDRQAADRFLRLIDAACVYHNASSRFSDGAQLGFGAEIGISTQKLHARGPFAMNELTTYKYVVEGNGQVRN